MELDLANGCPRLLVSVRNVEESLAAVAGGCNILDIKEPLHGPLGMASRDTIAELIEHHRRAAWHVPLSAALGELVDWEMPVECSLPAGLQFAKLGLSGCAAVPDWPQHWLAVRRELGNGSMRWIAVAYADSQAALAPSACEIAQAAIDTDCAGLLIDTFDKSGGMLLDHISVAQLHDLAKLLRKAELFLAVAGSLRAEVLPALESLAPEVIGIRGSACRESNRSAAIDREAVASFKQALAATIPEEIFAVQGCRPGRLFGNES